MSSKQQKLILNQFVSLTKQSDKSALKLLKQHNWSLDSALDSFFQATASPTTVNTTEISNIFDKYKDSLEDLILVQGTELLCSDLSLDPTDISVLVLAWHLSCPNMCEFTRTGWINGWTRLRCDSLEKMKHSVTFFNHELDNPQTFKEIYQFTFSFSKPTESKSLPLETAIAFWQLLLKDRYSYLDLWIEFLQEKYKKSISRDTWNLFLDFTIAVNSDFTKHDLDGAWPVVIDSFVEYSKEKLGLYKNEIF